MSDVEQSGNNHVLYEVLLYLTCVISGSSVVVF